MISQIHTLFSRLEMPTPNRISAALLGAMALAGSIGAVEARAASLSVDTFDVPAVPDFQFVESTGSGSDFEEAGAFAGSDVLGGFRDLNISILNSAPPFASASGTVFDGRLDWSNDNNVVSELTVAWDGNDGSAAVNATGLGGIDLTQGGLLDRFGLQLLAADSPGLTVAFTVYTAENLFSTLTRTFDSAINAPQQEFFEFANFTGNADFTNVGAVTLSLTGPAAMDASIALLDVTEPPSSVPEPSAIFGLAVLGGAIALRRR